MTGPAIGMGGGDDRYREWDAAYVLGSLSPAERHEYEYHLAGCPDCRAALAGLAGMPGLLASIPSEEALALLDRPLLEDASMQVGDSAAHTAGPDGPGRGFVAAASNRSRDDDRRVMSGRMRRRMVVVAVSVTAAAAAITLSLAVALSQTPGLSPEPSPNATLASLLTFTAAVPSPLTATATLDDEPWGTRIDWTCTYEKLGTSTYARDYAMIVTDHSGQTTRVATWTSGPGTTATPTATTSIHRADIASVSIVDSESGTVLLRSDPEAR